ncbi:hypothetical protein KC317_g17329 [Hortaea werneckii]|nr:hypothetical protein KC317_g17329 [Hortaea werneckii]
MAYDQSSAYEPPRRAYMGHIQQQHQWAPSHGYAAQGYNKQDAYMQQSYGPHLMHPTENTKDFKEHSKTNSKLQIEVHNIVSHPFTITNIHANRPETSHTVSNFEARRSTNTKCRVNVTTTLDTSNAPVEHLRKPTVIQEFSRPGHDQRNK